MLLLAKLLISYIDKLRDENAAINTQFWRVYKYKKKSPRHHTKNIAEALGVTTVYEKENILSLTPFDLKIPQKGGFLSQLRAK